MHQLICGKCGIDFQHVRKRTYCGTWCANKANAGKERHYLEMEKQHSVWACGGGVQSTAIAALICLGKLPKPDLAWIVDVGWEKSKTFDYVRATITPKLDEVGVRLEIIKSIDYVDNSLFEPTNNCRLPLYAKGSDGIVRKYKTHCSGLWKQRVAHKWLRSKGVKRCDTWIGISVDEQRRMKESHVKWNQNRYPLIELGLRREDCIDLIARVGWPKPEHTACYLCPNQSDFQWQDLKENYPEDWARAVEADEYIRSINPDLYLHGSCKPLKEKAFNTTYTGRFFVGKECFGDCEPTG